MESSLSLTPDERDETVFYCRACHSLHVLVDEGLADGDWDGSYCGKCGSADIGECTLGEWLSVEAERMARAEEREWKR